MPKQRDAVRMTEAERVAFIEERRSMIVATLDEHGAPHLTVLWFCIDNGTYVFQTYGTSQKVVNLRRDPRISLLWEAGDTPEELRGVSVKGRAEIVEGGPRFIQLMRPFILRNVPHADPDKLDESAANMGRKRVAVVVHPEKTFSWDHRKLGGKGV